ncbi:tetratricopeptide repeat-containing sensor histidine kinase [Emticicia agri]|uniref:histidine kinase n=1 Tax=Emticicia agri TaxID=2492393 RepID=A0A4Q5M1T9_9BACT|nr:tetratricopeptide repeat-containing sensor histidine kinase [Emticicia agri]RYU96224.1 tetratricopeptide repeat-containing sensor histidine kinase [Emticicia agri]
MKKTFVFFTCLCFSTSYLSFAQYPKTIDSLTVFLKTEKQDTVYVQALSEFTFQKIQHGKYATADSGITALEALSKKLNYGTGFYRAMNSRGFLAYSKQNYDVALDYFLKCAEIIDTYKLPKRTYQNALNNISIAYGANGDREKATKYAMDLIDFQEKNKLKPLKSSPYDRIANNLQHYKKYDEALVYYKKALQIEIDNNNKIYIAIAENSIGNIYELMKKPDEAIACFLRGLKSAEEADYTLLQTDFLTNLGRLYFAKNEFGKAEAYLKKSEKLIKELEANQSLKIVYQNLGDLYAKQHKNELAEKYYLEALALAKESKDIYMFYSINENLSVFYADTRQYEKAYEYKLASETAKDSTFKLETAKNTEELQTKYETKQKEQEIALLNEKNANASLQNKGITFGSVLLLLLAGVFTILILNRNKLKRLQEAEKLCNRIASDLHDEIGSTLSSILLISGMAKNQHIIQTNEGSNRMFSKIHSDSQHVMESVDEIIWSVNPVHDSLQGILLRLREYALPLAESKNISFDFKVDEDIENLALPMEIRRNLYLIIKEAINNLIKYSEASKANVHFVKDKKDISVTVEDNGKGFDTLASTTRNGLKNMKLRAAEMGAKIDILSNPQSGSLIKLSFSIT